MSRPRDLDTLSGRLRHEKRTRRIQEAALQIFANRSFVGARVTEIARQAGVADGTIYLYFHNKEALWRALFDAKLREMRESLLRELAGIDAIAARVVALGAFYLRQAAHHRCLTRFLLAQESLPPELALYSRIQRLAAWSDHVAVFKKAQADGFAAEGLTAETLCRLFSGAIEATCLAIAIDEIQDAEAQIGRLSLQLSRLILKSEAN